MTMTLDLAPDVQGALDEAARSQGRTAEALATEALRRLFLLRPGDADRAAFAAEVEAIREGLEDVDAGRTVAFEDFVAEERAKREERRPRWGPDETAEAAA